MKKWSTRIAVLLVITLLGSFLVGCKKKEETPAGNQESVTKDNGSKDGSTAADSSNKTEKKEYRMYTMFNAVPGTEVPDDNRMLVKLKEFTGAWAKVSWLTGQTAEERIGVMIAGGDYPDFITGSTGTPALVEAGALIAIDEYWDKYPNIKSYLSEEDWNRVREKDGHIYLIPQFGIIQGMISLLP